jgi:hypothetical protein
VRLICHWQILAGAAFFLYVVLSDVIFETSRTMLLTPLLGRGWRITWCGVEIDSKAPNGEEAAEPEASETLFNNPRKCGPRSTVQTRESRLSARFTLGWRGASKLLTVLMLRA